MRTLPLKSSWTDSSAAFSLRTEEAEGSGKVAPGLIGAIESKEDAREWAACAAAAIAEAIIRKCVDEFVRDKGW